MQLLIFLVQLNRCSMVCSTSVRRNDAATTNFSWYHKIFPDPV